MVNIKNKKNRNLDVTLRNFLSYMLYNVEDLVEQLSCEYTEAERRTFIYNCAVNTIYEFIRLDRTHILPIFASNKIVKLFKENFLLQQFHSPEITLGVVGLTANIIKSFDVLISPLTAQDKNDIMSNVNNLITSTI